MSRVDEYAPPFMGLDTGYKDSDSNMSPKAKNSAWFGELYSHSNFSVLGVYLNHGVSLTTGSKNEFKDSQWMTSLKILCDQGWGIVFFYLGLQKDVLDATKLWNVDKPTAATTKQANQVGKRHGRHVKLGVTRLLKNHKVDNNGSVVYVDNEYGSLNPAWRTYYNSMFEEMRSPGPAGCQPVRPGLYARDQTGMPNASELLDSNHDLFTWVLDHHDEGKDARRINRDRVANIPDEVDDSIHINPQWFEIRARRRNDVSSGRTITHIPVGSQGFLNYALKDPWEQHKRDKNPKAPLDAFPKMPTRALTSRLTPQTPWDFDMSFVQDPRYPVASPRVQCTNSTTVRGMHEKPDKQMRVQVLQGAVITILSGAKVEADAPLLLPDTKTIMTLDAAGQIIESTLTGSPETWTQMRSIMPNSSSRPLRRSRAVAAVVTLSGLTCVTYIANDLSINVLLRNDSKSQWAGPILVLETKIPMIHAFSNIAILSSASSPQSIDIVTISETSHLQLTSFTPEPSGHSISPGSNMSFENQKDPPSLLQGTAIAIARPHPLSVLVFAVSRSLMLAMFTSVAGQSWRGPIPLGRAATDRVFAHTRLATRAVNDVVVQVAAISYEGDPLVFTLNFDRASKAWKLAEPASNPSQRLNPNVFPRIKTKPPTLGVAMPLKPNELDAREWSINLFGDLNFGVEAAGTNEAVLMVPGSGPDTALGVLYRRTAIVNEDWYRKA